MDKQSIVHKVCDLYHKYGIKSVTMSDIANYLGMSKKTLYTFFKDKEDLVDHYVECDIEMFNNEFESIFAKNFDAIDELFAINRMVQGKIQGLAHAVLFDLKKYYPKQYRRFADYRRQRVMANVRANIKKGKAAGLYRAEIDEELMCKLHVVRLEGMLTSEVFTLDDFTSDEAFFNIMLYHVRGVATEQGIRALEEKRKEKWNI
ncbi:MAG: TetR/AcrR family transcriptional regulator [Bacteroidales bacterium]|nr:TetR/AcrR family transcriptional regulator [Bacteroidales bacterium]MBN2749289.1 TetR/AcrR family transcriptional regulator [Bacteroidales bacterium]